MVKEQIADVMEMSRNKVATENQSQNSEEWKELATVINKISFFVILFASVITAIICAILWNQG